MSKIPIYKGNAAKTPSPHSSRRNSNRLSPLGERSVHNSPYNYSRENLFRETAGNYEEERRIERQTRATQLNLPERLSMDGLFDRIPPKIVGRKKERFMSPFYLDETEDGEDLLLLQTRSLEDLHSPPSDSDSYNYYYYDELKEDPYVAPPKVLESRKSLSTPKISDADVAGFFMPRGSSPDISRKEKALRDRKRSEKLEQRRRESLEEQQAQDKEHGTRKEDISQPQLPPVEAASPAKIIGTTLGNIGNANESSSVFVFPKLGSNNVSAKSSPAKMPNVIEMAKLSTENSSPLKSPIKSILKTPGKSPKKGLTAMFAAFGVGSAVVAPTVPLPTPPTETLSNDTPLTDKLLGFCQSGQWKYVENVLKTLEKNASSAAPGTNPKPLTGVTDKESGWIPLMYAVKDSRHVPIAERMIALGCDPNTLTKSHQNVLHLASLHQKENNTSMLKMLLNIIPKEARLQQDEENNIPLFHCINMESKESCTELLTTLAKEQLKIKGGPNKDTALHMAVRKRNAEIVQKIIEAGANVDSRNGELQTAIHLAAALGDESLIKYFYSCNADPNLEDDQELTPMQLATQYGHTHIVDLLAEKFNVSVFQRTKDGSTLMHIASVHGHPETAMALFKRGVPLQMPNKGGARSIHIAARYGHANTVKKLLEKGENVDVRTNDNYTALHIAVEFEQPHVVETLLGCGALSHIKGGKSEETALHIAARTDEGEKCALMLLKSGADPHVTMDNGETPLHIAARHGKLQIIKLIMRDGADISQRSKEGETPLHLAARHGHVDVVTELIGSIRKDRGDADAYLYINTVTKKGESALHYAAKLYGDPSIVAPPSKGPMMSTASLGSVSRLNSLDSSPSLSPVDPRSPSGLKNLKSPVGVGPKAINAVGALLGGVAGIAAIKSPSPKNKRTTNADAGRKIAQLLLDGGASVHIKTRETQETPFHYCANEGSNEILQEILKRLHPGESMRAVNKQSLKGWSPLLTACHNGHTEVVETLMKHGARVDVFDLEGRSGLHLAAENGYKEICGILLSHRSFINAKSRVGFTALHYAAMNGYIDLCKFLINEHGAYVDVVTLKKQTPLHLAAETGQYTVCRLLLDLRANPDASDEEGQKPIHLAAENNHSEVIKLFLSPQNSMVSSSTKDGSTCAHLAATQGSVEVLKELLKFDKEGVISARNRSTDATALQLAAEGGHADLVKSLLDAGANPQEENRSGFAAVHLAARNGHTNVIEALRSADGVRIISKKSGLTALHVAAFYGKQDTVRDLLQDLPATTTSIAPNSVANSLIKELGRESGLTPLHMGAYSGEENVVRLLLNSQGVQVDAPTENLGFNPLHLACHGGFTTVVGLMLSKSSELLESKDASGKTSLHIAAIHGHKSMCEVLLGQGAQIDSVDKENWTPLHCAAKQGHLEVVRLLTESSASTLAKTSKGHSPIWFAAAETKNVVLSYLLKKEHDTYGNMEDHEFVFNLTICGKKNKNQPLIEFILASPAPVEVAAKLSHTLIIVSSKEKERTKDLIAASKLCEGMATELLVLAAGAESAGQLLEAVDRKNVEILDVLIENEQKEVVAHTVVQRYLAELWVGSIPWASWKLLLLFFTFVCVPPVWVIMSLPLGHRFHRVPIIRFMSYLTSHIHLIILLCLICVTPIYPVFPIRSNLFPIWFEWLFLAWILGNVVSEVLSPSDKGGLGWIKVAVLIFSIIAVLIHCAGFFINKSYYGVLIYIRNQMFAVAVLLAVVQILDYLSFHYLFGPWAIIIGNLMKDLSRFLAVLAIFMLGFSFTMSTMNLPIFERPEGVEIKEKLTNGLPSGVLVTPLDAFELLFFGLFGISQTSSLKIETGQPEWTLILFKLFFGVYMLVTVVVLINLLIAMMSDTYQRIQAQSDIEWKYGLAKLIRNYHRTAASPSPINLFSTWIIWIANKYLENHKPLNPLEMELKKKYKPKPLSRPVFGKLDPKKGWAKIRKDVMNPKVGDIMKLTIAQMNPNMARRSVGSRGSFGFGGVNAAAPMKQRIESVTDWPMIAKKYRALVGIVEPEIPQENNEVIIQSSAINLREG